MIKSMFDPAPVVELHQRDGLFSRYRYRLGANGIEVTVKTLLKKFVFTLPLDVMFEQPYEEIEGSKWWFWGTVLAMLGCLVCIPLPFIEPRRPMDNFAWLIGGTLAATCLMVYSRSRKHWVGHGRGSGALVVLWNQPSQPAVEHFLEQLRGVARTRVRERFLLAQKDEGAASELQRLAWLRDQQIISQEEFESFKRRLLGDAERRAGIGRGAGSPN